MLPGEIKNSCFLRQKNNKIKKNPYLPTLFFLHIQIGNQQLILVRLSWLFQVKRYLFSPTGRKADEKPIRALCTFPLSSPTPIFTVVLTTSHQPLTFISFLNFFICLLCPTKPILHQIKASTKFYNCVCLSYLVCSHLPYVHVLYSKMSPLLHIFWGVLHWGWWVEGSWGIVRGHRSYGRPLTCIITSIINPSSPSTHNKVHLIPDSHKDMPTKNAANMFLNALETVCKHEVCRQGLWGTVLISSTNCSQAPSLLWPVPSNLCSVNRSRPCRHIKHHKTCIVSHYRSSYSLSNVFFINWHLYSMQTEWNNEIYRHVKGFSGL